MKRVVSLLLAAFLLLSMASCGEKSSAELTPPTMKYLYNTNDGHKAIGEYLQSALAAAGFTMTLENQEWNTFLNTRKDGNYAIARNGWLADYNDPISFLDMWTSYSGNNDVQFGKGAHANLKMYSVDLTPYGGAKIENGTWAETYDVLMGLIKSSTDETKRFEMMHIAEDMLMDTGSIIPLYFYTDLYMLDDSVEGFYSNPLGYKYFMYSTVSDKTDNINVCLASEPDTLDPALNSAVDGATMTAHLFSGLAKWIKTDDGRLEIVADCAKELVEGTLNEDGTVTYVYTLRDGLKWSNGEELKASDFVNSWNRAASEELAADYGYMYEIVDGYGTDKLNAVADDANKTITVTIKNSAKYWNELLAFPCYFPVHSSAFTDEQWATKPETYINNGPYVMDSWEHKSKIVLKKNSNYIDANEITMEQITCYLSDDANNMLANFKKGDWQLIDDVPTNEIAALKRDFPTEFTVAGQIGTYYVCFNINFDLLPGSNLAGVEKEKAQAEIRKAMALLFDRNYIVEEIAQGGQIPASSFVAMGLTDANGSGEFYKLANKAAGNSYYGYYDTSKEAFEGNTAKALEVLKKYYKLTVAD